jgi:GNAT superfamily N-acetyltransferase
MQISDDVAAQARSPLSVGPDPLPETGARRVLTERYCAFLTPMPTVTFVDDLRLSAAEAADVQQEVRALLREAGRSQAAWVVSSTTPELHDALVGLGMTPYADPPLEAHATAMALTERPDWPASPNVTVREAVELDDYLAMGAMAAQNFDMSDADAAAILQVQRTRHQLVKEGRSQTWTFLAFLGDRLVGEGQCADVTFGSNLSGSSVSPEARGHGVYRALVAARWEHAVARGIPALTVQAGVMSAPILARLGFAVVDRQTVLCDRF